MAGYSGTPLPRKLGIKPGHRVSLVNPPPAFEKTLGDLPDDVIVSTSPADGEADVVLLFTDRRADLERGVPEQARRIYPSGALWVGWPKRASKVPTDVTGDVVREVALAAGLVDVKVCAIDETWSGLRLVYRLKDRR